MSQFSWSDNSQFLYTNWASDFNPSVGQQNQCGLMENKNAFWSTTNCNTENDFICKTSKGNKALLAL